MIGKSSKEQSKPAEVGKVDAFEQKPLDGQEGIAPDQGVRAENKTVHFKVNGIEIDHEGEKVSADNILKLANQDPAKFYLVDASDNTEFKGSDIIRNPDSREFLELPIGPTPVSF